MHSLLRRSVSAVFVLAVLLYVLQVFTPLRLTTDGVAYLSLADLAATQGFPALAHTEFQFPKGYPAFVFVLMKVGIFSSASMVLVNLICFAVGVALSFRTLLALGFERFQAVMACVLTVLSFAAVKHITQGMSDFLFFALAATACWFMTLQSRLKWLAILPCVACALEVRFIGLALLFPLAAMTWSSAKKRPVALARTGLVVAGLMIAGVWAGRHYVLKNFQILRLGGLAQFLGRNVIAHFQDFGEMMLNVPASKLPVWAYGVTLLVGIIAIVCFWTGIVVLWRRSPWCAAYMAGYCCLILPWPYTDPRFWLPAMPFVLLTLYAGASAVLKASFKTALEGVPKLAVVAYCILFCGLGFAALGYSTWLTFSGPKFPDRYGDRLLRTTYLTGCSAPGADVNLPALNLLRRYEWHCRDRQ